MTENKLRAWVRMPSRRRLDLANPTPFDWEDMDLAIGLARTFRWGGHSAWPRPMSVAQHCLLVLELRKSMSPVPLSKNECLQELLHDGEEGLIGWDCVSPAKALLGEPFKQLCDNLLRAVFTRYGVTWWSAEEKKAHKAADNLAAASEAVHVAGWEPAEVPAILGIKLSPLEVDPLVAIYGGTPWEPWPVRISAERFMAKLTEVLAMPD